MAGVAEIVLGALGKNTSAVSAVKNVSEAQNDPTKYLNALIDGAKVAQFWLERVAREVPLLGIGANVADLGKAIYDIEQAKDAGRAVQLGPLLTIVSSVSDLLADFAISSGARTLQPQVVVTGLIVKGLTTGLGYVSLVAGDLVVIPGRDVSSASPSNSPPSFDEFGNLIATLPEVVVTGKTPLVLLDENGQEILTIGRTGDDDFGGISIPIKDSDGNALLISLDTIEASLNSTALLQILTLDDRSLGSIQYRSDTSSSTYTEILDSQGVVTGSINRQTFDDDTSLVITTDRDGTSELLTSDPSGNPIGLVVSRTQAEQKVVEFFDFVDGKAVKVREIITEYNGADRVELVISYEGGELLRARNVYDQDGILVKSEEITKDGISGMTEMQAIAALNDIGALIGAIRGGAPLPVLSTGLNLINNQVNPTVGGVYVVESPQLSSVTGVVGGLASLYALSNAFESGDGLAQVNATLSSINYVNSTLPRLLDNSGPLSAGLSEVLNGSGGGLINGGVPGVLPALGLVMSIRSGDPVGIATGLIGVINPALLATSPVGWIVAGVQILSALFNEPPESWGTAKIVFDQNGQLKLDSVGEGSGPERVRIQLQGTLDVLNAMLAQAEASSPNNPLGIVPQRMPSITWREARQDDKGYAITDIDPITGEQRYPYLRWDDTGTPFSSRPDLWQPDPTDPNIRASFNQQLVESALKREAIAPQWEVDTARIQQEVGDPNAGLSETERAAKMGLGATYDEVGEPIGQFRALTVDLDGDGQISTVAKDAAGNDVAFNWDGAGYQKQVAWVQPNDGFLFLDRNLNGVVDSGGELFSNSRVSDDYKGVRSLESVDANRDGKITNVDPVFKELKIWQDVNGDGDNVTALANGSLTLDPGELRSLSDLGITELDYVNGRLTRDGNFFALRSQQLEADAEGTLVRAVESGIVINYSEGQQQFIISKVTSLVGGADRVDGVFEDGDPFGAPRTTPQEITIPVSLLLANDTIDPATTASMWRRWRARPWTRCAALSSRADPLRWPGRWASWTDPAGAA